MISSPYAVKPGSKVNLKKIKSDDTDGFNNRVACEAASAKNLKRLRELQETLYADATKSVLVVLQAMDAGGKDGTIEHVFGGVNPQGCQVTSFKVPSSLEKAHDFLWRVHAAVPPKGIIGIFNRSHYESVLAERVLKIAPKEVWKERYDHINSFEKLLVDEGTTVIKFYLHISKKEQAERLQARLDDPRKNWKFNPSDLDSRAQWNDYQAAFEDALSECSTAAAPWYVVPADRKWFRNWVVSDILVREMEKLRSKFPKPLKNLTQYKIE